MCVTRLCTHEAGKKKKKKKEEYVVVMNMFNEANVGCTVQLDQLWHESSDQQDLQCRNR
jgi:hypothetical protein